MDNYQEAHLIVAAIRVLEYTTGAPPSVEQISELLKISTEMCHAISRRLEKQKIIETITDPFSTKMSIVDHLALEEIPRQHKEGNSLLQELEKFQAKKVDMDKKVATIQAELKKKQESMFAGLEASFKKEMKKSQND